MHGELVLAPSFAVVENPPSLSFEDTASVRMTFVTVYGALVDQASLFSGKTVLIGGASSRVAGVDSGREYVCARSRPYYAYKRKAEATLPGEGSSRDCDRVLVEHQDVIQDEAAQEQSK